MKDNIKKYDIWIVDLEPIKWSEQSWIRPCLVFQNDTFFKFQNTSIVLPISSSKKENWNFKISIKNYKSCWLDKESSVLAFQIRTVDKTRFIKKIWTIDDIDLKNKIKRAVFLSIDLDDIFE